MADFQSTVGHNGCHSAQRTHVDEPELACSVFPFSDISQEDIVLETIGNGTRSQSSTLIPRSFSWNFVTQWIMKNERTRRKFVLMKRLDLDAVLALPVDLIDEILGHLHPVDLYHLSMTTKRVRRFVTSKSSISLWKTVFACHPDLPLPPSRFIEPRWAAILFGPSICEVCGRRGALMDFTIYTHLCTRCGRSRFIHVAATHEHLYPPGHVVWSMVPATFRIDGNTYYTAKVNWYARYLTSDVEEMGQRWEALHQDAQNGKPGAPEELELFEATGSHNATVIAEKAEIYHQWGDGICNKVYDDLNKKTARIVEEIFKRLKALGYEVQQEDWNTVESCVAVGFPHENLTPRVWQKIREEVQEAVTANINKRTAERRRQLIQARQVILRDLYKQFLSRQPPTSWQDSPSADTVLEFPLLAELTNSPSDSNTIEPSVRQQVTQQLPELVSAWKDGKRAALVEEVLLFDVSLRRREPNAEREAVLELAISVFWCPGCPRSADNCFIGWEGARKHNCSWLSPERRLLLSSWGSSVVSTLAIMLGFDAAATKTADLDSVDARFICACCPIEGYHRVHGHRAFTWRECVAHALEKEHTETHSAPSWHLISPEVTALVKAREQPHPNARDRSWSCSHCTWNFESFVKKREAVEHVKAVHSIARPVLDADYFYHWGADVPHSPRRQVMLEQEPSAEHKCSHCPKFPQRLFAMRDLLPHLRDKHEILEPAAGVDWTTIALLV